MSRKDPYAEFQKATDDPYAEFQKPPSSADVDNKQPEARKTLLQRAESYLPSARTTLRTGGSAIGGTIGLGGGSILGTPVAGIPGAAVGGAAGASIGESVYQLGQHLAEKYPLLRYVFPGEAPQTSGEAATRQAGAATEGALQEGVGAGLSTKLGPAFERSAIKSATRAVGPTSGQEIRAARDAAGEVVRELPFARNMTDLVGNLQGKLNVSTKELEGEYSKVQGSTIQQANQRIVAGLQKLRDKYIESSGQGFAPVKGAEDIVKSYDDMIKEFQIPDLPIEQMRQRRQVWDGLVNWWRKDIARTPAREEIYENTANLVRHEINTAFPQIAATNAKVSAWKDLLDIANEAEPASWLGGKHIPPSVLGGGVEMATGRLPSAFTLGHTVSYSTGPFRTAWRTATAAQKARIADLLNRGMVQEGIRELTRLASGGIQEISNRQDALDRLQPMVAH